MSIKLISLAAIGLVLSGNVNAGIITYGSYSYDTDTNVVVGDGLEWLQWSITRGMGYGATSQIGSSYGGGWEIATAGQIAGLINNFNFGLSWDPENPTNAGVSVPVTSDYKSGPFSNFISMFGYTYYGSEGNAFADWSKLGALAIFESSNNMTPSLRVWSYGSISRISCCDFQETADIYSYSNFYQSNLYSKTGVALVRRSTAPPISTVPVPAAAWLFGSGLIGLFGLSRRMKPKTHNK